MNNAPRWPTGRVWVRGLAAGLAHGLLMALAFPPLDLWPLALLAIAPLAWLASGFRRDGGGVLRLVLPVAIGAAPLWIYQSQWIMNVAPAGFPLMIGGLGLVTAMAVVLMVVLGRALPRAPLAAIVPMAWVAMEVIRGEVIVYGYAWLLVGHPLIELAPARWLGAAGGVYAVSIVAAMVSGLAVDMLGGDHRRGAFVATAGLLMVLGAGLGGRWSAGPTTPIRVAVVQTNVPQDNKMEWTPEQREQDLVRMLELTAQAGQMSPRPDVIVWPETMFPGDYLQDALREDGTSRPIAPAFVEAVLEIQSRLGVPLVVGSLAAEGLRIEGQGDQRRLAVDARFNSALLIREGRLGPRYDKMELTPFGEVMPYVRHWRWLERQIMAVAAQGMAFDLDAGRKPVVLEVGEVGLATPICFEVTKSAHVRRLARAAGGRAVVLINMSNDGWFGRFVPGKSQHFQIARWRAVELGVPMVRSVNTGISGFIDGEGRVVRSDQAGPLASGIDGVLVATVDARPVGTVFSMVGNLAGWMCVGGVAAGLGWGAVRWRRGRGSADSVGDS